MVDGDNTRALSEHTTDLIEKALRELRAGRSNSSSSKEQHFRTATYLLEEGRAYVRGAWSMVASGNAQASLALSRWVLEAAMNLWWVVGDSSRVHERLRELVGEALRNEACLREAQDMRLNRIAEDWVVPGAS